MKIVNREQFLKLPAYTLFSKYNRDGMVTYDTGGMVDHLTIKRESLENDYFYSDFDIFDYRNFTEFLEKIVQMEDNQGEFPVISYNGHTGRDELYDQDQLFIVYDQKDVETIIKSLQSCLAKYSE